MSPNIAGMESKNENLKAFSRFSPRSSAVEIVAPLLDKPGNIASPWATPISKAVLYVTLSVFSFPTLDV